MSDQAVYDRIQSACCEITGLKPAEMERHIRGITNIVVACRDTKYRATDVEPSMYLGYALLVTAEGVEVYDWDSGEFTERFASMSTARNFVRRRRAALDPATLETLPQGIPVAGSSAVSSGSTREDTGVSSGEAAMGTYGIGSGRPGVAALEHSRSGQ